MDQAALVAREPDVEAGRKLIEALDEARLDIQAALWIYMPEIGEWRLMLASSLVAQAGPKEVYQRIQSTLRELELDISLKDVGLVTPESPLIKAFHGTTRVPPKMGKLRLVQTRVGNVFFEAAIVYRIP